MKKFLIFALCFPLLLAGCGSSSSDSSTTEKEEETNQEVKQSNKPSVYQIGDVVENDIATITINSITETTSVDTYVNEEKLGEGKEYVVVDATVENVSDEPLNFSILASYRMVDGDGRECDVESIANTNGSLNATGLNPGEKMTGEVVFQAPTDGELFIKFYPELLGSENYKIQVR